MAVIIQNVQPNLKCTQWTFIFANTQQFAKCNRVFWIFFDWIFCYFVCKIAIKECCVTRRGQWGQKFLKFFLYAFRKLQHETCLTTLITSSSLIDTKEWEMSGTLKFKSYKYNLCKNKLIKIAFSDAGVIYAIRKTYHFLSFYAWHICTLSP